MNAPSKSLPLTTPSTSPETRRFVFPYAQINPGTTAENVFAFVDQVVHAPIPPRYREIDEVIREREANPRRAAALERARQRLAYKVRSDNGSTTIAKLRLGIGISQAKVAELLGTSQSSYSLIESGRRPDIMLSTFAKLAGIFGVSLDEFAAAIKNTAERRP